jgi:toxin HigB-1
MIVSISHKGLSDFFYFGSKKSLNSDHIKKISIILAKLDSAEVIEDIALTTPTLHKLKGDLDGYYSVRVSGNWRIIFQFVDGNVYLVDYLDYH